MTEDKGKVEEKTEADLIRDMPTDDLRRLHADVGVDLERRDKASQRWACTTCGWLMDYAYVMEAEDGGSAPFDSQGCLNPLCDGMQAVLVVEAKTEAED